MKVLIDTNVILDALMNRMPWAKAAQDIMRAVAIYSGFSQLLHF